MLGLALHRWEMQHWNVTSLKCFLLCKLGSENSSGGLLRKATKTSGLSTWMRRCLRRSGVLLLSSLSPFGHFSQEKLALVGREEKFILEGSWGSSFPFQLTPFQWLRELIILFYWLVIYPLYPLTPDLTLSSSMDFWELIGHSLKWFELLEESQGIHQKLVH